VYLRYVEPVHITNVRVKTFDVLTDNPRVEFDITVKNQLREVRTLYLSAIFGAYKFSPPEYQSELISIEIKPHSSHQLTISHILDDKQKKYFQLWQPDDPVLLDWTVHLVARASEEYT